MGLGQRLAQPGGLRREVTADLVGVQVRLREQVPDAGQGEVPTVAGGAQELLEHGELEDRVGRLALGVDRGGLHPAVQRRHVVRPGLGEHPVDRDVRPG